MAKLQRLQSSMRIDLDVQYATMLSELVYRAAECTTEESFLAAKALVETELGASLPKVQRHKSGGQRYLVGESDAAIYVAFLGTKHAADWLANLNFFHFPIFHSKHASRRCSSSGSSDSSTSSSSARAHVGFIRRANQSALSISALHATAAAAGKRLILCGHSLGGAVATLTTVRLLRALSNSSSSGGDEGNRAPQGNMADIRCISFASPAVANTDLLQEVAAAGWDSYITNIILPEDPVLPFVNRLLKAPAAPAAAPDASSSSSSPLDAAVDLHRSGSSGSSLYLSRAGSSESAWSEDYEQQQQQRFALQAAVAGGAGWEFDYGTPASQQQMYASAVSTSLGGSKELNSWLAVARNAVQLRRQHHRILCRSLSESSEAHSTSTSSLCSLQSSAAESTDSWGSSSSSSAGTTDSLAAFTNQLEATMQLATSWVAAEGNTGSSMNSSSSAATTNGRKWHLGLTKAGIALVTGALAAGVRCAAAVAAPQLLGGPLASLGSALPGAFTAPIALAAMHLVGSAAIKAALPVSHPLGQQWVMTGEGLERVVKPLKAYAKNPESLRLKELGGLFPGHRMIAYRRRLVKLLEEKSSQ